MRHANAALCLMLTGTLLCAQSNAAAQEKQADVKIYTQMTVEQAEAFLKKQGVEYKKVETKNPGTVFYDFKRGNLNLRFSYFDGKDLMLEAVFGGLPLERINEWNRKAKFSRASLGRDGVNTFSALESNIDLAGGVTEGALKQFFASFDEELRIFMKYAGDAEADDQLFTPVTSQKIEALLKGLNITYEKNELKNNLGQYFDFDAGTFKIRLVNYGGKDLMIDARFKKISLDDINRWNLQNKFIRAVAYNVNGMEYSALEMNLDCEVGTSDGILRNFIVGFHEDVKHFAKYVQER